MTMPESAASGHAVSWPNRIARYADISHRADAADEIERQKTFEPFISFEQPARARKHVVDREVEKDRDSRAGRLARREAGVQALEHDRQDEEMHANTQHTDTREREK